MSPWQLWSCRPAEPRKTCGDTVEAPTFNEIFSSAVATHSSSSSSSAGLAALHFNIQFYKAALLDSFLSFFRNNFHEVSSLLGLLLRRCIFLLVRVIKGLLGSCEQEDRAQMRQCVSCRLDLNRNRAQRRAFASFARLRTIVPFLATLPSALIPPFLPLPLPLSPFFPFPFPSLPFPSLPFPFPPDRSHPKDSKRLWIAGLHRLCSRRSFALRSLAR